MTKWEYCEVHVQSTKGHTSALVSPTFGEPRELEGSDARFPQLFRVLGQEGWEAVGFIARNFETLERADGTKVNAPGVDTRYLLKRQVGQT